MKAFRVFASCSLLLLAVREAAADPAAAVASYQGASAQLVAKMRIIKRDAGSCGIIGGQLAGKMDGSVQTQASRDAQVAASLEKAKDGAKGQAVAIIQGVIEEVNTGNEKLKSNYDTVEYGLSTDSPSCRSAKAAFEAMASTSESLPKLLAKIAGTL